MDGPWHLVRSRSRRRPDHPRRSSLEARDSCFRCLLRGHWAAACPNPWRCLLCGQFGHRRRVCPVSAPKVRPAVAGTDGNTHPFSYGQGRPEGSGTGMRTQPPPSPPPPPPSPDGEVRIEGSWNFYQLESSLSHCLVGIVKSPLVSSATLSEMLGRLGLLSSSRRLARIGSNTFLLSELHPADHRGLLYQTVWKDSPMETYWRCLSPWDGSLPIRPPQRSPAWIKIEGIPLSLRSPRFVSDMLADFAEVHRCANLSVSSGDCTSIYALVLPRVGVRRPRNLVVRSPSGAFFVQINRVDGVPPLPLHLSSVDPSRHTTGFWRTFGSASSAGAGTPTDAPLQSPRTAGAEPGKTFRETQVLSVTLDAWSDEEIESMVEVGGNSYANAIYEAFLPQGYSKPGPDASKEERTSFIRSKYELQEFLKPSLRIVSNKSFRHIDSSKTDSSIRSNSSKSEAGMVEFIGILKVKVIKGTNLAVRDMLTSDPYVVLTLGQQRVQTTIIKSNLNPIWNEELKISVPQRFRSMKLEVYDHDTFSADDIMGDAEIDIQPLITAAMAFGDATLLENMQIGKWLKTHDNALIHDSIVNIADGKVKQGMSLKLQNVESGELELELEWLPIDQ